MVGRLRGFKGNSLHRRPGTPIAKNRTRTAARPDPWRPGLPGVGGMPKHSHGSGRKRDMMTEQELMPVVLRARDGDRAAYGELVERFQSTVYAVALARLRNPTEAQELAQEVFLHAMKKLPQLRDVQCFAGWLRQITVRMAINRLTRHGPLARADSDVLEQAEAVSTTPLD